jgi:hypothetical protein
MAGVATETFCQSCAMPLQRPEDFGTAVDGARADEYCRFCYQNGAFLQPDATQQGMIDKCVRVMADQHIMPEAQARALMTTVIPTLKRWRT